MKIKGNKRESIQEFTFLFLKVIKYITLGRGVNYFV